MVLHFDSSAMLESPTNAIHNAPKNIWQGRLDQGQRTLIDAALRTGTLLRFAVGTDPRYLAELFAAIG